MAKHAHHVVPHRLGGTRTVPLCHECHERAHERTLNLKEHSEKIKAGQQRARASGKALGRPKLDVDDDLIAALRGEGLTYRNISERMGISIHIVRYRLNAMGIE